MKNLFIAALVMTGVSVFAKNEEPKLSKEKEKKEDAATFACCRRTAHNAYGESASIESCVEYSGAQNFAGAQGRACDNALSIARQLVRLMAAQH